MSVDYHVYVGPFATTVMDGPDAMELADQALMDVRDMCGCPADGRLIPNMMNRGEPREFNIDVVHGDTVDDIGIVPEHEKDWFVKAYGPELAKIAAHCGADPVVNWGVFTYAS